MLQQWYQKRLPRKQTWLLIIASIVLADLMACGVGAAVQRQVFPWIPTGAAIAAVHLAGMLVTRRWWAMPASWFP